MALAINPQCTKLFLAALCCAVLFLDVQIYVS